MRRRAFANFLVLVLLSGWILTLPAIAQVDAWRSKEPVVRYDGDKVVRVEPRNATELEAALALSDDVWSEGTILGLPVDLHVTAQQLKRLKRAGLRYTILIDDLQAVIDTESAQLRQAQAFAISADWHKAYHRYGEVLVFMKQLAEQYPKVVHYVESIGPSVEGRDIAALRISNFTNKSAKKRVVVLAGQHAREWISTAVVQYWADQLAATYSLDSRVTTLLTKVEILFIPIVNPDGYEYTWTTNRLWRKNRGATVKGRTYGVDLDRNWDDHWGSPGASAQRKAEDYRGPVAFSEPETVAVAQYLAGLTRARLVVDVHSYSQLIMRPYGWTQTVSPDEASLAAAGSLAVEAIKADRGTLYVSEREQELYIASGTATDWVYGANTGVGERPPASFTLELSPAFASGGQGFVLPPENIIPVGKEVMKALLTLSEYAIAHPLAVKK